MSEEQMVGLVQGALAEHGITDEGIGGGAAESVGGAGDEDTGHGMTGRQPGPPG